MVVPFLRREGRPQEPPPAPTPAPEGAQPARGRARCPQGAPGPRPGCPPGQIRPVVGRMLQGRLAAWAPAAGGRMQIFNRFLNIFEAARLQSGGTQMLSEGYICSIYMIIYILSRIKIIRDWNRFSQQTSGPAPLLCFLVRAVNSH